MTPEKPTPKPAAVRTDSTPPRYFRICQIIVANGPFTFLMGVITIWSLVGEDIRLAYCLREDDLIFQVLTVICLTFFTIEIIAQYIAKADYAWGFFFYLDIVATSSMLLDIQVVQDWFFGIVLSMTSGEGGEGQGDTAKAGRAGRAGARAGRIVRIIRLIRLIRIFKLWKQYEGKNKDKVIVKRWGRAGSDDSPENMDEVEDTASESLLSQRMSDTTTRKVIVIVISMLFAVPQFNVENYANTNSATLSMTGREFSVNNLLVAHSAALCEDGHVGDTRTYVGYVGDHPHAEGALPVDCTSTGPSGGFYDKLGSQTAGAARDVFENHLLLFLYHFIYVQYHPGNVWILQQPSAPQINLVWLKTFDISYTAASNPGQTQTDTGYPLIRNLASETDTECAGVTCQWLWTLYQKDCDYYHELGANYLLMVTVTGDAAFDRSVGCLGFDEFKGIWNKIIAPGPSDVCEAKNGAARTEGVSFFRYSPAARGRTLECVSELRPIEITESAIYSVNDFQFQFIFSTRLFVSMEAKFNMMLTILVCIVLCAGGLLISKDATDLVLRPIERMIAMMNQIKKNPLVATQLGMGQDKPPEKKKSKLRQMWDFLYGKCRLVYRFLAEEKKVTKENDPGAMETAILEKTLIKLGGLLALGLGEAGIDIVGQNLASERLDAMVPGRRMEAILGFVDIRGFNLVTEVLNEKVTLFVNQIAEIVHSICDIHCGAPNKNNGDTFLLVWQFELEESRSKMADLCLLCSVKCISAVRKSPVMNSYNMHPALICKEFKAGLGFGLHSGWAIEGALGSQLKIDASYLSPHVALTLLMEHATKHYGVGITVSDTLARVMDSEMARMLRPIDCVYLRGSKTPVEILSMDLRVENIQPYKKFRPHSSKWIELGYGKIWIEQKHRLKFLRLQKKDSYFPEDDSWRAMNVFNGNKFLTDMRASYTKEFFQTYRKGYLNYRAGEWDVAIDTFTESESMLGFSDHPSHVLIAYMKSHAVNGTAPKSWKGVREW